MIINKDILIPVRMIFKSEWKANREIWVRVLTWHASPHSLETAKRRFNSDLLGLHGEIKDHPDLNPLKSYHMVEGEDDFDLRLPF